MTVYEFNHQLNKYKREHSLEKYTNCLMTVEEAQEKIKYIVTKDLQVIDISPTLKIKKQDYYGGIAHIFIYKSKRIARLLKPNTEERLSLEETTIFEDLDSALWYANLLYQNRRRIMENQQEAYLKAKAKHDKAYKVLKAYIKEYPDVFI